MKKTILVTGETGFVGSALVKELILRGYNVRFDQAKFISLVTLPELENKDWSDFLKDIDCIVHCSGQTPTKKKKYKSDFFESNVYHTKVLANQAILNGVKHFIYISSASVKNNIKRKFFQSNLYKYAASKLEAEKILKKKFFIKKIKITILRPPVVYGPFVKGNFFKLLKWISFGLPYFNLKVKKNYISISNLISCIIHCIKYPKLSSGTFEITDKKKLSFEEFIRKIYMLMNKKIIIVSLPSFFSIFFSYLYFNSENVLLNSNSYIKKKNEMGTYI